jgi:hypothetical protein
MPDARGRAGYHGVPRRRPWPDDGGAMQSPVSPSAAARPRQMSCVCFDRKQPCARGQERRSGANAQGGPIFRSPLMTDYHYSGPLPFNRQYRIQQNFFVSADVGPDMTIVLDFDLSLGLGGRTSGGTDFNGNATGPTDQSIFVGVYNASAAVSNNGNRFITWEDVHSAHDQIIALAQSPLPDIPLTGGPFLSLKLLANAEAVLLDDAIFQENGGPGIIALFIKAL